MEMKWLFVIAIIGFVVYFLLKDGNRKFWKYVNRNKDEAYDFFIHNDCWYVIHPNEDKSKPNEGEWLGPFFVEINTIGRLKIFGKMEEIEKKQMEFIAMIDSKE